MASRIRYRQVGLLGDTDAERREIEDAIKEIRKTKIDRLRPVEIQRLHEHRSNNRCRRWSGSGDDGTGEPGGDTL